MSYKAGDLKVTVQQCEHADCEGESGCDYAGSRFWVSDSREKLWPDPNYKKHGAYLPHSCDEWYIGGKDEIEALIADLKAALEGM